jgi:hypothetical protein
MKPIKALAAALALFAASPAHSRDEFVAKGIATLEAYDVKCAPVPRALMDQMKAAWKTVTNDAALDDAMHQVLSQLDSEGTAAWCATTKPAIDRAADRLKK